MSLMTGNELAIASAILEAVAKVERLPENVVRSYLSPIRDDVYERCVASLITHGHVQRHEGLLVLANPRRMQNIVGEIEVTVRRSERYGDTMLVKVKHLPRLFHHRTVIHGDYRHPRIFNQDGWRLDDHMWYMVDDEGGLRLHRCGYPRVIDLKTMREMQVDNV